MNYNDKISILLPTKNRLHLLKNAVSSILRCNDRFFEIVISDNASDSSVEEWVKNQNNKKIKYHKFSSEVPVTDNWNKAYELSTGSYFIMLGDDDVLLPSFFKTIRNLIVQNRYPDMIYSSTVQYVAANAVKNNELPELSRYDYGFFFGGAKSPFFLSDKQREYAVRSFLNFNCVLGYNMQFSVISRNFAKKLLFKSALFHSPYPDFYLTNLALATSKDILINPQPIAAIGIFDKSFGSFFYNGDEEKGVKFLNNSDYSGYSKYERSKIISGPRNNTSWYLSALSFLKAVELIKPSVKVETQLNIKRYRYLQIGTILKLSILDRNTSIGLNLSKELSIKEKLLLFLPLYLIFHLIYLFPESLRSGIVGTIRKIIAQYKVQDQNNSISLPVDTGILDITEHIPKSWKIDE